ncbi:MAG: sulfatase [Planctomycetota bacterium]
MSRALRPPALALVAALLPAACGGGGEPRTNVVLIVVDTLRADHVLDPDGLVSTPNLDALAADGALFERAYTHTSWTLPSHTALFSSRPPHETGVTLNSQLVPADLPLVAEWLGARGYATRAVHSLISLFPVQPGGGLDRGFDTFVDSMDMGYARAPEVTAQVTPVLSELAASDQPFFLFLHYSDPHEPYHAYGTAGTPGELVLNDEVIGRQENIAEPETIATRATLAPGANRLEFRTAGEVVPRVVSVVGPTGELELAFGRADDGQAFGTVMNDTGAALEVDVTFYGHELPDEAESRRRYVLEIEHLDRWLGSVCDELSRLGLYEESLIVLTSDHGEGLGDHGMLSHGLSVFDELLHVPLVIKAPAAHPARPALEARRGELARHVDLVPTMLSLLDLPALPGQTGVSLVEPAERVLEAEMHYPLEADQYALFDGRWKLIWAPDTGRYVLFDLASDPSETHDVYAERAPQLEGWRDRLRAMAERLAQTDVGLSPDLPPEVAEQLEAVGYVGHR